MKSGLKRWLCGGGRLPMVIQRHGKKVSIETFSIHFSRLVHVSAVQDVPNNPHFTNTWFMLLLAEQFGTYWTYGSIICQLKVQLNWIKLHFVLVCYSTHVCSNHMPGVVIWEKSQNPKERNLYFFGFTMVLPISAFICQNAVCSPSAYSRWRTPHSQSNLCTK